MVKGISLREAVVDRLKRAKVSENSMANNQYELLVGMSIAQSTPPRDASDAHDLERSHQDLVATEIGKFLRKTNADKADDVDLDTLVTSVSQEISRNAQRQVALR